MWTRKNLKDKAKTTFKMNYWKTVLVAFLVMVLTGASVGASSGAASGSGSREQATQTETLTQEQLDELMNELEEQGVVSEETAENLPPMVVEMLEGQTENASPELTPSGMPEIPAQLIAAFVAVVGVIVVLALAIVLVVEAFVVNPLHVGTARFFALNLNQRAEVKEVAWGYDHNYRETVRTMFWRDIYTLLWGLLLVIPGIVKAYEYCMIPYLLAENPTLTKDEAFAQSKAMMTGNKWRAFVLDLSFIGWDLLSLLTLGVLSIFYVAPYKNMTKAALYEELRYGKGTPTDDGRMLAASAPAAEGNIPVPVFATADVPASLWDEDDASADSDSDASDPVVPEAPEA